MQAWENEKGRECQSGDEVTVVQCTFQSSRGERGEGDTNQEKEGIAPA